MANGKKHQQQQKPLLCIFSSVLRHSLSSSSTSVPDHTTSSSGMRSPKKTTGIVATGGGLLLFRRSSRRYGHHYQHLLVFRYLPVLLLVVLFVVFSFALFLSPPISDHLHRRTSTVDLLINDKKSIKSISLSRDLWSTPSSQFYHACSNASKHFLTADVKTQPERYLLISTSGGLNQQRTGITDAVVAAYILNATLIVPMLDQKSYWKDASDFGDIFDVEWFISFLKNDVKILKTLPPVRGKIITPVHTRVPRKCKPKYYVDRILPLLKKKNAVQLTKYDYRLSNNLNADLQKLRCRVNYHALRFTDPILEMGRQLVERMRMRSKHYIALHLRFEPDMLAFSGCDYGGGDKERKELGTIRKRWKTLHKSDPDKQRRQGRCPLTPEEVGLMLRALGYGSDVHIYVASGEVYGRDETLEPLRKLFPNFYSKDSITSQEELAPFASYSARMAALDFIVCDESDVFVTNNNGNMARILAGRRRYNGHKPTIRPNAKKLSRLFMNRTDVSWDVFTAEVRIHQVGFMGEPNETKLGKGEFHENPAACICQGGKDIGRSFDTSEAVADYHTLEDEQDLVDPDDTDRELVLPEKDLLRASSKDPAVILTSDHPELTELLSD